MRSSYTKDIFRTIGKNFKRFVAIMAITTLGITTFLGVTAACRDIFIAADRFYDEQHLFDIRVLSTLGLTSEDVEALQKIDGIVVADGIYSEVVTITINDLKRSAEVMLISPKGFNMPYIIEGRLPENTGEVVVTPRYLNASGKNIGDTIIIEENIDLDNTDIENIAADDAASDSISNITQGASGNDETDTSDDDLETDIDWDADIDVEKEPEKPNFLNTEYVITGIAIDPMTIDGGLDSMSFRYGNAGEFSFFVLPDNIDTDIYTSIYIELQGLAELDCFSDEYSDAVQSVIELIEDEIMEQRQQARYSTVVDDAQVLITDAETLMNDKFAEADEKFADAWTKIEEAKQEVLDGEAELSQEEKDALRKLADARAEINRGKNQLIAAETELATALTELKKGQAEYESGLADYNGGLAVYEANRTDINKLALGVQQGVPEAMSGMSTILTQFGGNDGINAIPGVSEQFVRAAEGVIAAIDGVSVLLKEASETDLALMYDRISLEAGNELASKNYKGTYEFLKVIDVQLNPIDPASPTLYVIMQSTVASAVAELDKAKIGLDNASQQLAKGKAELDDGWKKYNDGVAKLASGRAELASGEAKLNSEEATALKEIADAWQKIADGKIEIEDGESELLENEEKYRDKQQEARQELADAYAKLEDIDMAQWYVQDRTSIPSFSGLDSDVSSINIIGRAFPVLFLIVAILISLTTMTRMVEEERGLIGIYKALGFSSLAIGWKYILYAILASLFGGAVGNILGFIVLPNLLMPIFRILYTIPNIKLLFDLQSAIFGVMLFLVSNVVATAFACFHELNQTAASLMQPKAPRPGKRIFLERIPFIWKRLRFLNKVTARNLFRYKKRMYMTAVGIAGCTALVFAGFAIQNSVESWLPKQYGEINVFDMMVVTSAEDNDKLFERLDGDSEVDEYIPIQMENVKVLNEEYASVNSQLIVIPTGSSLESYVNTVNRKGIPVELDDSSVLITENAADLLGITKGTNFTIQNSNLERRDVVVLDVIENYLGNSIYITQELYESLYDIYEPNAAYVHLTIDPDEHPAYAELLLEEDYIYAAMSTERLKISFEDDFVILRYVIFILTMLAAGLAFVVLFTLANTNISERKRELATIKVLGFFDTEVHSYVNKETLILTMIGIVAGLPLGYVLSGWLLAALKMPSLQFVLVTHPLSYLYTSAISFSFALVINMITNLILNRIDMVEALKSVD